MLRNISMECFGNFVFILITYFFCNATTTFHIALRKLFSQIREVYTIENTQKCFNNFLQLFIKHLVESFWLYFRCFWEMFTLNVNLFFSSFYPQIYIPGFSWPCAILTFQIIMRGIDEFFWKFLSFSVSSALRKC